MTDCKINEFCSRVCEKGTKGCTILHTEDNHKCGDTPELTCIHEYCICGRRENIVTEDNNSMPKKQPPPNDQWCVGCSPDNCPGGCDLGRKEDNNSMPEYPIISVDDFLKMLRVDEWEDRNGNTPLLERISLLSKTNNIYAEQELQLIIALIHKHHNKLDYITVMRLVKYISEQSIHDEAIAQAKLRGAPCKYSCEAQAFKIEIRQLKSRLSQANREAADFLDEAANEIAEWGEYAGDYFKERHDLAGTVKKFKEYASKYREAIKAIGD